MYGKATNVSRVMALYLSHMRCCRYECYCFHNFQAYFLTMCLRINQLEDIQLTTLGIQNNLLLMEVANLL